MVVKKILAICPLRQRQESARLLMKSFYDTSVGVADLVFVIDEDDRKFDPEIAGRSIMVDRDYAGIKWANEVRRNLGSYDGFMFLGDDIRLETQGWDEILYGHLLTSRLFGIVCGNDYHWGNRAASHPVIGRRLIESLGWSVLPGIRHFVDFGWTALGGKLGILKHDMSVKTRHLRWDVLRSEPDHLWKENYMQCARHDLKIYHHWLMHGRSADCDRVRKAITKHNETNIPTNPRSSMGDQQVVTS